MYPHPARHEVMQESVKAAIRVGAHPADAKHWDGPDFHKKPTFPLMFPSRDAEG